TVASTYTGNPSELHGTFDNGATSDELRLLARAFDATKEPKDDAAFIKGLDCILKAQYPTGGWPQFYPPDKKYHRYITFNDDAMVRLMYFLRETSTEKTYAFVDADQRRAAEESFN